MTTILAFYIWGAHWRHLKNTTEPFTCGGDAALRQIYFDHLFIFSTLPEDTWMQVPKYECEEYLLLYQVLIRWPITSVLYHPS